MYKMYKIVKICKNLETGVFQVIHIEMPKGGKTDVFKKLSTLSIKRAKNGGLLRAIKERTFCEDITKMQFCRKRNDY